MSIYYFDTSAVVKRYVTEPGALWIRQLCSAHDPDTDARLHKIYLGEITRVEVASALTKKAHRTKEITEQDANDAYKRFLAHMKEEYRGVSLAPNLLSSAAELARKHVMRAYDAVQLALALHVDALLKENALKLIFVSGDDKLLQAAQAEKLATDNPFAHVDLG